MVGNYGRWRKRKSRSGCGWWRLRRCGKGPGWELLVLCEEGRLIRPSSSRGQWIGIQILSSLGYGSCSQMPILAVQVVFSKPDIPTGLVMVMFFQMLGSALAPSVGQNLFTDGLLQNLSKVQGIDSAAVVAASASGFRTIDPPELMNAVVDAFNSSLRNVFWVALANPALAWITSWQWSGGNCPTPRKQLARLQLRKSRKKWHDTNRSWPEV